MLAAFLADLSLVVAQVVAWVGDVLALFSTQVVLQLFLGVALGGWILSRITRLVIRR